VSPPCPPCLRCSLSLAPSSFRLCVVCLEVPRIPSLPSCGCAGLCGGMVSRVQPPPALAKVVEVGEVVNVALGSPTSRHQLTELIHRLPLFLQLCPLMPRLKAAKFLLGDHRVSAPHLPVAVPRHCTRQ